MGLFWYSVVHFFVTSFQSKTAVSELKDTTSKVTFILVQPVNTISTRMFSLARSANKKGNCCIDSFDNVLKQLGDDHLTSIYCLPWMIS